ncbi:rhodanese-like domain-containing protein [Pirellulales bacterium]|nr:rhodanese-like domain-containing protein [Pirellulales bacterium]
MPPIETTCDEVHARRHSDQPLLLIDCREPDEHAIAAIEGARLLPLGDFPDRVGELGPPGDAAITVYCHLGGRSLRAAQWLREQGYSNAQSMAGGIDQWAVEIDTSLQRY